MDTSKTDCAETRVHHKCWGLIIDEDLEGSVSNIPYLVSAYKCTRCGLVEWECTTIDRYCLGVFHIMENTPVRGEEGYIHDWIH